MHSAASAAAASLPPAAAQRPRPDHLWPGRTGRTPDTGFFGNVSRGLASVIERAVSQWGLPNGYVLGEEGSGAFVAGLRYGEGTLYTKNAGDLRVYWQGPSVGFDWGGDGARTMTLVYNLPATSAIYQRFAGIDGSAYIIGGFGMTALTANNIVLVPIRSGIGLRLGANIGYLKFTPKRDLEPVLSLPSPRPPPTGQLHGHAEPGWRLSSGFYRTAYLQQPDFAAVTARVRRTKFFWLGFTLTRIALAFAASPWHCD